MPIPITGRIARQSARRPWLTLGVWAALLVVALMSAGTIGEHVTSARAAILEGLDELGISLDELVNFGKCRHKVCVIANRFNLHHFPPLMKRIVWASILS